MPSGSYSKLTYNSTDNVFVVKAYGVNDKTYPATTDTLDNLNIKIKLSNFTEGIIKKTNRIPGTYQRVEQHHKGIEEITKSMVEGTIEAVDMMVFIFVLGGMPGSVFILGQLVVFIFLGLIVPSSSGLAVLSMPIMAPLADSVGIPRDIVVSAYNWGQYAMLFLAPTGLVLVTLQMLHIPFDRWVKFVMPMIGCLLLIGSILLVVQVSLYSV
ncbi:TPA: hypothetical protein ACPP6Y_001729 [Haemophilus influenzae]